MPAPWKRDPVVAAVCDLAARGLPLGPFQHLALTWDTLEGGGRKALHHTDPTCAACAAMPQPSPVTDLAPDDRLYVCGQCLRVDGAVRERRAGIFYWDRVLAAHGRAVTGAVLLDLMESCAAAGWGPTSDATFAQLTAAAAALVGPVEVLGARQEHVQTELALFREEVAVLGDRPTVAPLLQVAAVTEALATECESRFATLARSWPAGRLAALLLEEDPDEPELAVVDRSRNRVPWSVLPELADDGFSSGFAAAACAQVVATVGDLVMVRTTRLAAAAMDHFAEVPAVSTPAVPVTVDQARTVLAALAADGDWDRYQLADLLRAAAVALA